MSAAEQWETVTVRVEDIVSGDQISFGGVWLPVDRVDAEGSIVTLVFAGRGEIGLPADVQMEVRRPNPDAELVDIMSTAYYGGSGYTASFTHRTRAAIADARAAGWRIERAS